MAARWPARSSVPRRAHCQERRMQPMQPRRLVIMPSQEHPLSRSTQQSRKKAVAGDAMFTTW